MSGNVFLMCYRKMTKRKLPNFLGASYEELSVLITIIVPCGGIYNMIWCYRHYKVSLVFVYITQIYLYQSENSYAVFLDIIWCCIIKFGICLLQRVAENILNFRINYHLRWWFIIHALHVDLLTFIIYYNRKHKRSYNGFNSFCLMIIPNRRMRLRKNDTIFILLHDQRKSYQLLLLLIIR